MAGSSKLSRAGLFFAVGPLRTGSSLMARCIDDHPAAICLCESEINRALFSDYFLDLHCERMLNHGFTLGEAVQFLDRKKQNDIPSWLKWYAQVAGHVSRLYEKPYLPVFGEKSPDFYKSDELVAFLADNFPLIYTVRDPRAIFRSIEVQEDATAEYKAERWDSLVQNYLAWKPYLDGPNVLVVRYEDLVTHPVETMYSVYEHLDLPYSLRFLEPFPRLFPQRFLWETAVAWDSGVNREFDATRITSWQSALTEEQLEVVYSTPTILEFIERFRYEKPRFPRRTEASSPSCDDGADVASSAAHPCSTGRN